MYVCIFANLFSVLVLIYIRYQLEFGLNSMRFVFSFINLVSSILEHGKRFPVIFLVMILVFSSVAQKVKAKGNVE